MRAGRGQDDQDDSTPLTQPVTPGPGLSRCARRGWFRPSPTAWHGDRELVLRPRCPAQANGVQAAAPKCPGAALKALAHTGSRDWPPPVPPVCPPLPPPPPPVAGLTWMPFSCRFRYRVLTGMLAGTSARSLRVQITRLAWLLQEQAEGHEVAGGEPPPAADVKATPPPPAPRGGEKSQRKSRAPWGQDILPGGSGGHVEPQARAILTAHAPRGRRGAAGGGERERRGSVRDPSAQDTQLPAAAAPVLTSLPSSHPSSPCWEDGAHFTELKTEARERKCLPEATWPVSGEVSQIQNLVLARPAWPRG